MKKEKPLQTHTGERTLADSIICKVDADQARREIKEKQRRLNAALAGLASMRTELGKLPDRLEDINRQWANTIITEKETRLYDLPLPEAQIKLVAEKWQKCRELAYDKIDDVMTAIDALDKMGVEINYEKSKHIAYVSNLEEAVTQLATVSTTDTDRENWRLLCNLRDDYRKYLQHCKRNGLFTNLSFEYLMSIDTPDKYLEEASKGHFTQSPTTKQLRRDNPYFFS